MLSITKVTCPVDFYSVSSIPLGMESGAILDSQIIASSVHSSTTAHFHPRLHFKQTASTAGSWSARTNNINQWLQVNLLETTEVICIATQGRNKIQQWVTKYKLQYGDDENTLQFYRQNGDLLDMVSILYAV